jgi:hypothetical protein
MSTITIVSCYFKIKSKQPHEQYYAWMKQFLMIKCNMVIYVDIESRNMIYDIRKSYGLENFTVLLVTTIEKFHIYKYVEYFKYCNLIDPEKYHTPELYMLWHEKTFMCNRSIEFNHFNSEWFFWCDIGCFRDEKFDTRLSKFPNIEIINKLDKTKMTIFEINCLNQHEKEIYNQLPVCFKSLRARDCIQGTFFGGHKNSFKLWTENYIKVLENFIENKYNGGKDQSIMTSIAILYPEIVNVIKANTNYGDIWWYFKYYFSEKIESKLENNASIVSVNIMGGLGNQLFQIAAAYSYAKKEKGNLQIIHKLDNGNRPVYWETILYKIKPYLVNKIPYNLLYWSEQYPTIYKQIPSLTEKGIYLAGYLQSSKYFYDDETKSEIKQLFRPSESLLNQITNKYQYLIKNKERVVVIHARRTDYLKHPDFHAPLTGKYYKNALELINVKINIKNPIFVLSSDDNTFWNEIKDDIKQVFDLEHFIIENETDINTFALLQQFEHYIMSNSTFIWWCVWLSNSKNVISPKKWFGHAGPKLFNDIFEKDWTIIEY